MRRTPGPGDGRGSGGGRRRGRVRRGPVLLRTPGAEFVELRDGNGRAAVTRRGRALHHARPRPDRDRRPRREPAVRTSASMPAARPASESAHRRDSGPGRRLPDLVGRNDGEVAGDHQRTGGERRRKRPGLAHPRRGGPRPDRGDTGSAARVAELAAQRRHAMSSTQSSRREAARPPRPRRRVCHHTVPWPGRSRRSSSSRTSRASRRSSGCTSSARASSCAWREPAATRSRRRAPTLRRSSSSTSCSPTSTGSTSAAASASAPTSRSSC